MLNIFPDFSSVRQTCDWIELYILCEAEKLSKSELRKFITSYGDDDSDVHIADIFAELKRRQSMMGQNSAIVLDELDIVRRNNYIWKDIPEYVMCLIFSLQGVKKIKGDDDGTKLFERIAKDVIKSYLDGEAIVLGFPNNMSLNQQLIELEARCYETKSKDRIPASTDKDKGVDIIGWKSHLDGRNNQVVLLIQAAAGYHWNLKKPISKPVWRDFIMWSADLNIGIIVAGTLDEIEFKKARDDYNLVFDRIRIFISLYKRNLSIEESLRTSVIHWCIKELELNSEVA